MQIEIHGETERLINVMLATGKYESAEDIIAEMLKQLSGDGEIQRLPNHVEVDAMAEHQGVKPIKHFRDLSATFSPPGETTAEFLSFLYRNRGHDAPHVP